MNDKTPFYQSKSFLTVLYVFASITLVLMIFAVGVFVGYQQAGNSYKWGENYYRNFLGDRRRPPNFMGEKEFFNSHGLLGTIIQLDTSETSHTLSSNLNGESAKLPITIVVKDNDGMERMVVISAETVIKQNRDTLPLNALKIDDEIVVIGTPDDTGKMEAKLIRVGPPPLPPDFPDFNMDPRPRSRG